MDKRVASFVFRIVVRLVLWRNQIVVVSVKMEVWVEEMVNGKHVVRLMPFSEGAQILNRRIRLIAFNLAVWVNSHSLEIFSRLFSNIVWLFLQIKHIYSLSVMHFMQQFLH